MHRYYLMLIMSTLLISSCEQHHEHITFQVINLTNQQPIGFIHTHDVPAGTVFEPELKDSKLQHGLHGFHVHETANCEEAGKAAGSHMILNDYETEHGKPWSKSSHAGDLPNLYIDGQGNASIPVLSPRLHVQDLRGRALIIHANTDNYSEEPKLGGSGARVACALIVEQ